MEKSEGNPEDTHKTEEAVKKAGVGAADVLSNISSEIKEGITEK